MIFSRLICFDPIFFYFRKIFVSVDNFDRPAVVSDKAHSLELHFWHRQLILAIELLARKDLAVQNLLFGFLKLFYKIRRLGGYHKTFGIKLHGTNRAVGPIAQVEVQVDSVILQSTLL